MKIRTDFVTNSSSSSFVAVNINSPTLDAYLEKLGIPNWFKNPVEVEDEAWYEDEENFDAWFKSVFDMLCENYELVEKELQPSATLSLLTLLELVGVPYWGGDAEKEKLDKLRSFLEQNRTAIDAEAQGSITVKEADGEGGFAYYQKLEVDGGHGKLTQWPVANGWTEEGINAIEAYNCEYGPIFRTIWNDEELAEYLKDDGKVTEF